jgi:hypothetical protein
LGLSFAVMVPKQFKQIESDEPSILSLCGCPEEACLIMMSPHEKVLQLLCYLIGKGSRWLLAAYDTRGGLLFGRSYSLGSGAIGLFEGYLEVELVLASRFLIDC